MGNGKSSIWAKQWLFLNFSNFSNGTVSVGKFTFFEINIKELPKIPVLASAIYPVTKVKLLAKMRERSM